MKKLFIYIILSFVFVLNTAAGCGSNGSDPTPKNTTLGLVGGRWEVQTNSVQLFNWNPDTKTLGNYVWRRAGLYF
jgi:hypothetical protein